MKTIYLDNSILSEDKKHTYLSADVSSGSVIVVQSNAGLATGQILLIGEIGQEEAEIVRTHSNAAVSGSTITLKDALAFAHSIDTKITIIDWNQFEVAHSTTALTTGIDSTLTYGTALQVDQPESLYKDTSQTSGYYFTRLVDTVGSAYSDYSDAIPYSGFADNTVWAIKDRALNKVDARIDEKISHDWLNECLWEARREYHNAPGKRPFRRKYNSDMGNVSCGKYKYEVPSDLEDPNSAKNIFGIRIGKNNVVNFYDKKRFDDDYIDTAHSTLLYNISSTSAVSFSVADARDFASSGVVYVEDDTITYTAKNVSSGSITTVITGTTQHSAGIDVWQNISFGLPNYYTIMKNPEETGYIYFNRPFETAYTDQNIWMDYYRTLVAYDSDADILDEPDYDCYVSYLAYRIKKKLNPNLDEFKDSDFLDWQRRKQLALNNEYLGVEISFYPDIPQ